jgi:hypothetical protein
VEAACRAGQDADLGPALLPPGRLEQKKWLWLHLAPGGRKLATLEPLSAAFTLCDAPVQGYYRLSRFACLRRLNREMVLESPLGHGRIFLHHGPAAALAALLADPRNAADLCGTLPIAGAPDIEAFINMLQSAGALFPCDGEGASEEGVRPCASGNSTTFISQPQQGGRTTTSREEPSLSWGKSYPCRG